MPVPDPEKFLRGAAGNFFDATWDFVSTSLGRLEISGPRGDSSLEKEESRQVS